VDSPVAPDDPTQGVGHEEEGSQSLGDHQLDRAAPEAPVGLSWNGFEVFVNSRRKTNVDTSGMNVTAQGRVRVNDHWVEIATEVIGADARYIEKVGRWALGLENELRKNYRITQGKMVLREVPLCPSAM